MENSTLLVLIYVLIILVVWLVGLRAYKDDIFIDSTTESGFTVFVVGIFWPIGLWLALMNNFCPLFVKLLKKMHSIKF
jgi:hypothetical protein